MLIEAAKGGHTPIVQLLLNYSSACTPHDASAAPMLLPQQQQQPQQQQHQQQQHQHQQHISYQQHVPHPQTSTQSQQHPQPQQTTEQSQTQTKHNTQKSLLRKNRSVTMMSDMGLTSAEAQQVRSQPAGETVTTKDDTNILDKGSGGFTNLTEPNISLSPTSTTTQGVNTTESRKNTRQEQILHKQQILEELQVRSMLHFNAFLLTLKKNMKYMITK